MPYFIVLMSLLQLLACRSLSRSQQNEAQVESADETADAAKLPEAKQKIFSSSTKDLPQYNPKPGPTSSDGNKASDPKKESLFSDLKSIASVKTCKTDSSCIVVGLNRKACGLPTAYALFSKEAPRYLEVDGLIQELLALDAENRGEAVSVCGASPAPTAMCRQNKCVTICVEGPCAPLDL